MTSLSEQVREFLTNSAGPVYVGIDPGASGGLALIADDRVASWDLPMLRREVRRSRDTARSTKGSVSILDYGEVTEAFRVLADSGRVAVCVLEKIPPRTSPGRLTIGDVKAFGSYMLWPLFLYALRFAVREVAPVVWKKFFGLTGQPKTAHRAVALQRFPGCEAIRLRSKDGRVDALLLAEYGKRQIDSTR